MGRQSTDHKMKRQRIKSTLMLVLIATSLMAAYQCGAMFGAFVLKRLSKEKDFRRAQINDARAMTQELNICARLELIRTLEHAELSQLRRNSQGDSHGLPSDRIGELRDRLFRDVQRLEARIEVDANGAGL